MPRYATVRPRNASPSSSSCDSDSESDYPPPRHGTSRRAPERTYTSGSASRAPTSGTSSYPKSPTYQYGSHSTRGYSYTTRSGRDGYTTSSRSTRTADRSRRSRALSPSPPPRRYTRSPSPFLQYTTRTAYDVSDFPTYAPRRTSFPSSGLGSQSRRAEPRYQDRTPRAETKSRYAEVKPRDSGKKAKYEEKKPQRYEERRPSQSFCSSGRPTDRDGDRTHSSYHGTSRDSRREPPSTKSYYYTSSRQDSCREPSSTKSFYYTSSRQDSRREPSSTKSSYYTSSRQDSRREPPVSPRYTKSSYYASSRQDSRREPPPSPRYTRASRPTPKVELPNHYATLGISAAATEDQIKAAAKKLRIAKHPDRLKKPGMTEEQKTRIDDAAKKIGEAAEVLGDKESRKKYDCERQGR